MRVSRLVKIQQELTAIADTIEEAREMLDDAQMALGGNLDNVEVLHETLIENPNGYRGKWEEA